jgi:hypothetical protein
MPTKTAVVLLILFLGIGTAIFLIIAGTPSVYPPTLQSLSAQMIFWGAISAAINAARTPGRWNERIRRAGKDTPSSRVWPIFMIFLFVTNYLVAIAVVLGSLPFAPRRSFLTTP